MRKYGWLDIKKQGCVALTAIVMLSSMAANASPCYEASGRWEFNWAGIPFAKLNLHLREDGAASYALNADFKSKGLMKLFSAAKTTTQANLYCDETKSYTPKITYRNLTKGNHAELRYNANGEVIKRVVEPEDNPLYRAAISLNQLKGSHSAGDALFALSRALHKHPPTAGSRTSLRLYDGKRLFDAHADYAGLVAYRHGSVIRQLHKFSLTRELIEGFTEKEMTRYQQIGDPPVALYLSDDGRYFPIAMHARLPIGEMRAIWREEISLQQ